ncbi:hypothetical protein EJ06DRAFT_559966 [Trichodelitschia bisporula]|uniref:FAD/NAD(P)-binding domain-containing protein n=1 Tax=Trichodelitschia bisporula TaxID=703511 RepID=A0A6G1HK65_9PEZI|nr:hypothetical protein EJ06DRAFT_559966 [Trichodelitschia bisporula]
MARDLPNHVDTIIIGGGPSSLILSYILHGHIPRYAKPHHDPLLNTKLSRRPYLLDLTPDVYAHFQSSLRYSTQALPINVLLDTLIRPNADTEVNPESCIVWHYEPWRAVSHVVLSNAPEPGGQWAEKNQSSDEIGVLSYSEMLSLPGYSFADHCAAHGKVSADLHRPSRREVSEYIAAYPEAVGISDSFFRSIHVENVSRTENGFLVQSPNIHCDHLVLATGIFTLNQKPPPHLAPIGHLSDPDKPLLVIGSGFSAADIILSTPPNRKVLHLFRWSPDTRPSPLRGCHHTAYPEYASVYRQMKLAAISSGKSEHAISPPPRRRRNPFFNDRDWASFYEGLPNAEIVGIVMESTSATLQIRLESGEVVEREVGGLFYNVGRRGSLDYLSASLRREVLGTRGDATPPAGEHISARTLRAKAEVDLEIAKNVFIIGSLTGDSLIRHAYGGCVYAAQKIMNPHTLDNRAL